MEQVLEFDDLEMRWDRPLIPRPTRRFRIPQHRNYLPFAIIVVTLVFLLVLGVTVAYAYNSLKGQDAESQIVPEQNVAVPVEVNNPVEAVPENPPVVVTTVEEPIQEVGEDLIISEQSVALRLWSRKLNSYLEGTELEGTGELFAEAALKYGIDPRLSASISQMESQRGKYTPNGNPYNYWGLTSIHGGYRKFSSQREAIFEHAAYLERKYGKDATPEDISQIYCPPNWKNWQMVVRDNMRKISLQ